MRIFMAINAVKERRTGQDFPIEWIVAGNFSHALETISVPPAFLPCYLFYQFIQYFHTFGKWRHSRR